MVKMNAGVFVAQILLIFAPLVRCDYTGLPLIGVISVPAPRLLNNEYFNGQTYWSLIPKSYTSYIGQTGAMPLLIPYDIPLETLDHLLSQVSGIHFIGGGAPFFNQDGKPTFWLTRVKHIMKVAKKYNDEGKYFPILGTSLGMQSMVLAMARNDRDILSCDYDDHETNHSIQKTSEFVNSQFWGKIDSELVDRAFSNGYLYYSHICGFNPVKLANNPAF